MLLTDYWFSFILILRVKDIKINYLYKVNSISSDSNQPKLCKRPLWPNVPQKHSAWSSICPRERASAKGKIGTSVGIYVWIDCYSPSWASSSTGSTPVTTISVKLSISLKIKQKSTLTVVITYLSQKMPVKNKVHYITTLIDNSFHSFTLIP